jgi:hypothetical protein
MMAKFFMISILTLFNMKDFVELLVKSPESIVHLASWRESYNIFTCQAKSESSLNWKWKTI